MGEIVAAFGTCHAPQLFTRPPDEDPAQLDSSIAGMRQLGKLLDETRPDVLIFLGSDHLETFSLTCVPSFAIVSGSRAFATFAGRDYQVPIHRELAEHFLEKLIEKNFDIAYSEDAVLGHTFAVPFEFVLEKRSIPIVPFFTNVYLPPLPSPRRCAALGAAIKEILQNRKERVAILASGGMSHFPGTWKYPHPEFDFDAWLIAELEKGNSDALLSLTGPQLDEVGNTELLTWSVMLGAIGSQAGRLIQYTPTWHHGHAMMQFLPRVPASSAGSTAKPFTFKNQGFEFYKHPPASAYQLNKLLFDVRHNHTLRVRLLENLEAVAAEYHLTAEEREAAAVIPLAGTAVRVSDHAAPLVKAGAHPLQALMSLHAVAGEYRKLQRAKANDVEKGS